MRRWMIPVGCVVMVAAGVLAVHEPARTADPPKPAAWEYKVVGQYDLGVIGGGKGGVGTTADIEKGLNKLGADGWELVTVLPAPALAHPTYYLKRAKAR